MWASDDWLGFCGFENTQVVGQTLKILQGPDTDADTIVALMDAVARTDSINVRLTNYTRHGIPFSHDLKVEPLTNSHGEPVLYRVQSRNVVTLLEQGLVNGLVASTEQAESAEQTFHPDEAVAPPAD